MENYKFINNNKCEFFPCHKTEDKDNFNCLFCYCPLYLMEEKCMGNFTYTKNGIKDCSNCLLPHKKENYDYINNKLMEFTNMKKEEKLKNIKLIITDLDHTLLKDEFSIDENYVSLFNELKDMGYITAFATARGFYQAFNFAYKLKPDYIICDNGASLVKYDYENQKRHILKEILIEEETKKDVLNTLKDKDTLIFLIESREDLYITKTKYNPEIVNKNINFFSPIENIVEGFKLHVIDKLRDMPFDIPLTRVCTFDFVGDKNTHDTLKRLGENHDKLNYTKSFTTTFEFGPSTKGNALLFLKDYLKIAKENIISFGDSITDVSMFENSGVSVCVDNASDEVKKHAMYITDSVFDNGVENFIRENLLNEK